MLIWIIFIYRWIFIIQKAPKKYTNQIINIFFSEDGALSEVKRNRCYSNKQMALNGKQMALNGKQMVLNGKQMVLNGYISCQLRVGIGREMAPKQNQKEGMKLQISIKDQYH